MSTTRQIGPMRALTNASSTGMASSSPMTRPIGTPDEVFIGQSVYSTIENHPWFQYVISVLRMTTSNNNNNSTSGAKLMISEKSPPRNVSMFFKTILRFLLSTSGTLAAFGFLRYLVFLFQYKLSQSRNLLPLPPGPVPLPILGHLTKILQFPDPVGNPLVHIALMDEAVKHNGLFGIWLGAQYTVVITKPSVAEEAYCEHKLESGFIPRGSQTTDRASLQSEGKPHVPSIYIATRNGQGIAMSTGDYWRKVRGRVVSHITSPSISIKHAKLIQEEVESVVWSWRMSALRQENLEDLTAQLKRESMNMGMRVLFSIRFGAELNEDFKNLKFAVEYIFQALGAGNPGDMIPFLRAIPTLAMREMTRVVKMRDEILGRIIAKHREEFLSLRAQGKMSTMSDARDVADMFFFDQIDGYQKPDGTMGKLTEDEVHVCLWDLIFAMTDTTASTNEYLILNLINNPDVQRKVHEELDRVVGPNRLPRLEDKDNLPYLWATIKETMRYRLISPVMAPHYATEDITLHDTNGKEFFIPKGTQLFMHGYSMAMDPTLWKTDPKKFYPERWFEKENEGLDLFGQNRRPKTEHYKFMPFSIGPRMCPGYAFAKVAQFIQAANLMHCFKYSLNPSAHKTTFVSQGKLDMTECWGLTIMPQRYGEKKLIRHSLRPASVLAKRMPGDLATTNVFLNRQRKSVALLHRERLSHDSILLRFGLEKSNQILGLPVGKHFKVFMPNLIGSEPGKWNGREDPSFERKEIERAYTPTTGDNEAGFVDLVVKVYDRNQNLKFPDGGKITQQLNRLRVGDKIDINGPYGHIEYLGKGQFKLGKDNIVTKKRVGMIAGGSGITPMYQILMNALYDEEDHTQFGLIYANQTEEDILLRKDLEMLREKFPQRFWLHYTLDRPPENGWEYSTGFVTDVMLKNKMPIPGNDTLILACGPPPMIEFAIKPNLEKLGYEKSQLVVF